MAKAYLHGKFHLDPFNRLATDRQKDNGPIASDEPFYKRSAQKVKKRDKSQTDRETDNGPTAQGQPFYKRLPRNLLLCVKVTASQRCDVFLRQCVLSCSCQ